MSENKKSKKKSRRSFIHQASGAMGVVAVSAAGWPLVDQMNPSKDVEALATIEVDISGLSEGKVKLFYGVANLYLLNIEVKMR